ncbi:hypothetical protein H6A03_11995 [[Clostridium] spiroforme]|nr:hypothetical protein [Thomasclavelia spiroformis]MBM6881271.1 hypothetical protein [Thomasclavelia spiroformis]MBM6931261.1 hypothetical protein [Thomasclavelia spiroformis]
MSNRKIKKECYFEQLNNALISVEMVFNQLRKLNDNDEIDRTIIIKDMIRTKFQLELSLASLCIILRKMNENDFIKLNQARRKDVNSIIHSNKFEFIDEHQIFVFSQKGKEEVDLYELIDYAKSFL